MSFLPFQNDDGTPNKSAAFVNALLCAALYHNDQRPFEHYGRICGARLAGFASDKHTYQPDHGVLISGNSALVALDGTTNLAQWLGHCAGTVVAITDPKVPVTIGPIHGRAQANASFLGGLNLIEPLLDEILAPIGTGPISITGHSYGGAAAFVFGRHLVNSLGKPTRTEIMTFGEPKAYDGRPADVEPDVHLRIISQVWPIPDQGGNYEVSGVDPVTVCPPAFLQLSRPGGAWKYARKIFGFTWTQHGDPFLLGVNYYVKANPLPYFLDLLPSNAVTALTTNAQFYELHFMDTCYLPRARAAWARSGLNRELAPLQIYVSEYLTDPFAAANDLGPELLADVMNQMFDPRTQPVTTANRPEWDSVSANGYWNVLPITSARKGDEMTIMKGTMAFNSIQGGFSESVLSTDPTESLQSMMQKMQTVMGKRCLLSMTDGSGPGCQNPIIPQFVRVEDTLVKRDAITVSETSKRPGYTTAGNDENIWNQNLDLELGWRVQYFGGSPRQSVAIVHHGVPTWAFNKNSDAGSPLMINSAFLREARPKPGWLDRLYDYVGTLAQLGLGFRTIDGAWNNVDGSPGPYSSPDHVYYNPDLQQVELQWATEGVGNDPPYFPARLRIAGQDQQPPNWPNINSKCRVQIRQWPGFQVLQGRWAGQVCSPQTGYAFALRILRRCRAPQVTNRPFVSPIAWSQWYPGQNFVPKSFPPLNLVQVRNCATLELIESKKLGKNFEQQRGRQRNRPT